MEVQELKQLIKSNELPNFLIFTGEEYKVQQIYIEQIAKVKKLPIHRADSMEEIWGELNSKSLFEETALYLLRDDKDLLTNEKLYSKITDVLGKNMLILTLTSADKRLKMLKVYKDSIVEFKALKSDILKRYIQKEIPLSDRNCEILMEICDYNYGHCLLEIDKIKKWRELFIKDKEEPIPFDGAFLHLLNDGAIYVPPRDTIWDFIKTFLQHKPEQAYELYTELKELQTPTFAILTNLYNNAKQVLQVQVCTSKDIAKTTGLSSWQIRNARECVNRFRARDLAYLMRTIQQVELWIKQGVMDESIAVDYIFVNIM